MGHWYREDGSPAHFEGKDGKGTTLREARKLDLYPSVTTVGQVVAKFALTNWLQEEAAMMAAETIWLLELESDRNYYDREWAKTVVAASREKTMAKADAGTDIHDILERYMNGESVEEKDMPMCWAVDDLIMENTLHDRDDFDTETRFCDTKHGYAGMCDLHNEHWIIDYKTKDTVDDKTRGWPEQAEQLAAYAHGLGYPNARLANVFISREDPTEVVWHEHKDDMAWERFRHTLMLWQVSKKFGPYYESLIK